MRKILLPVIFLYSISLSAQDQGFVFTTIHEVQSSSVKDQAKSGTCWSFATTSFIESELLRMEGKEYDLSEMYFVRQAYVKKAENFYRLHGIASINPGGQAHDVMNTIRIAGMMPESAYSGLVCSEMHNHRELDASLAGVMNSLIKVDPPATNHLLAVSAILDAYLGPLPKEFEANGKSYDAVSFAKASKINPDDYIELTSYSHHPFYSRFILEVPDNWSYGSYYNVPLDELIRTMKYALQKGYSITWDGDVSDPGFSHKNGVALVPDDGAENIFTDPNAEEKLVTQEMRQTAFDEFQSTDDHLMHITGLVSDQLGTQYFVTKNSWGTERNSSGGYLNMSESYIRLNTIAIMVHKDAVPKDIRQKLGF